MIDQLGAALTSLMMLVNAASVFWYWRRRDASLTVLGAFLPRLWLAAILAAVALDLFGVVEAARYIGFGLLWLCAAELAHMGVIAAKNHGHQ